MRAANQNYNNTYSQIIQYLNGNRYEGETLYNIPHGQGKLYFANGDIYTGNFLHGASIGKGIMNFQNGDMYIGDFLNGLRTGKGTICFRDGTVYIGDFLNGKRTGNGVMYFINGTVYKSNFLNGVGIGKGIMNFQNGDMYIGDFLGGVRAGKGVMIFANGSIYIGDFLNGVSTGRGIIYFTDGNIYVGDFLNNQFNGQGIMLYKDGNIHQGDFVKGVCTGKSRYYAPNGNSLEGEFKNFNIISNSKATFWTLNSATAEVEYAENLRFKTLKGDLDKFIVKHERDKNSTKSNVDFLLISNQFLNNGTILITNPQSKELVNNLQSRIKNTQFKDKISFERIDNFDNILRLNNNKIRFISTGCPGHAFNIMIDEAENRAIMLDDGAFAIIPEHKEQIENYLKNLSLTVSHQPIAFKDINSFINCVNQSQAMLEKLCRWFERGDMYKNSSKQSENTAITLDTKGEEIIEKLSANPISLASNMHKMHQNGVGSGISVDLTNLTQNEEQIASISFSDEKKVTEVNTKKVQNQSTNLFNTL